MTRLEAALRTPIAFSRIAASDRHAPSISEILASGPETVGIEFEGRFFVWYAFPSEERPGIGHEEYGPTLTVVVEDEADERAAANDLQRFLSALAFHTQQPVEAMGYGGSEANDPYDPPVFRLARSHLGWKGWMLTEPPAGLVMRPEPMVRTALAYFREGLNATSPFYRFVAFWNSVEASFGGDPGNQRRDAFVRSFEDRARARWGAQSPFPDDLAARMREDSRNAIAHVLRRDPEVTHIDPDAAADRVRLTEEADLLRWIAEEAVNQEFPGAVTVIRSA